MSWDAKDRDGRAYTGNIHDQEYFPMSFGREAVEANAVYRLTLVPGG